jgi:hypothetical protein
MDIFNNYLSRSTCSYKISGQYVGGLSQLHELIYANTHMIFVLVGGLYQKWQLFVRNLINDNNVFFGCFFRKFLWTSQITVSMERKYLEINHSRIGSVVIILLSDKLSLVSLNAS